jgi:malic enzyme
VFGESSTQDERIMFSGAGTQSVSTSRTISASTAETAKIYIVQPNRETFLPGVSYSMTCQ